MCIQLPPSSTLTDKEDTNGSTSMGKLAEILEQNGMIDVNTDRLTARIPVVKFNCPIDGDSDGDNGSTSSSSSSKVIECDVSMQNPLACINTALLRTYSGILPEVRILAAIVKRWAKSRNINNPADHTLSSYGYILMLLYFLTTHRGVLGVEGNESNDGNMGGSGDIVDVHDRDALRHYQRRRRTRPSSSSSHSRPYHDDDDYYHCSSTKNDMNNITVAPCTLLPNIQWMDPTWLQSPPSTPFRELHKRPSDPYSTLVHPSEPSYTVNTYFTQLNDSTVVRSLRARLSPNANPASTSSPKPSLATLLAQFFHFYAYQFDYRRHVVSLHATPTHGRIEREAKAETDGWKLYGQALCVEDPFECFYDVAHVLKPG